MPRIRSLSQMQEHMSRAAMAMAAQAARATRARRTLVCPGPMRLARREGRARRRRWLRRQVNQQQHAQALLELLPSPAQLAASVTLKRFRPGATGAMCSARRLPPRPAFKPNAELLPILKAGRPFNLIRLVAAHVLSPGFACNFGVALHESSRWALWYAYVWEPFRSRPGHTSWSA
ncbi:hypothetical protein ABPG77_006012 [Micractinium sp. CCAP 211/92]